jgi:SAM-dependent methyltransferase
MGSPEYFSNTRKEVLALLPSHTERILEIGCGSGNTLSYAKSQGLCRWTGGVEISPEAARQARDQLDWVLEGDIEKLPLPLEDGSIDAILCLDVLEHLVDPWQLIPRLHHKLRIGGALIASIPNVRNFHVVLPLLLRGRWTYEAYGLLDRTHLRFFTKSSACELVACSGLDIDRVEATGVAGKTGLLNLLTLRQFEGHFAFQYLIRAIRRQ